MPNAATLDEHLPMVDEALVEIDDQRAATECDHEGTVPAAGSVEELHAPVRALREEIAAGDHRFEDADLPFTALVAARPSHLLPLEHLLASTDGIQPEGFGTDD